MEVTNTAAPDDLDAAICEEMSKSLRRKLDSAEQPSEIDQTDLSHPTQPIPSSSRSALADSHAVPSSSRPPSSRVGGRSRPSRDTESDYFFSANYFSRTDATSSSSSETDTSSEDEKIIEEFASRLPPKQKMSFLSGARPPTRHRRPSREVKSQQMQPTPSDTSAQPIPSPSFPPSSIPIPPSLQSVRPPLPKRDKRRRGRRSVAANRRSCLLRCMRQYRTECQQLETIEQIKMSPIVPGPFSGPIPFVKHPVATPDIGHLWADILPLVVSGFLDLKSVVNLRKCCKRLYFKRRYVYKSGDTLFKIHCLGHNSVENAPGAVVT